MHTIEYSSWLDFANSITLSLNREAQEVVYPKYFRGQSDATWQLKTTLERYTGLQLGVVSYFDIIKEIQPQVETFTNKKWDLPRSEEFIANLSHIGSTSNAPIPFHYMAYLRHMGFPSPLLDWTYSPFVVAYFAFRDIASKAESVAIYTYMESWESKPITGTDKTQFSQYMHIPEITNDTIFNKVFTLFVLKIAMSIFTFLIMKTPVYSD